VEKLLAELHAGRGVQIVTYERDLTTQQAAELLNVSRQYLVRLLDAGAIPYTRVGTHRRLRLQDVLSYRNLRHSERRASLARITRLSQEMGDY
jgi:excisionase family DNA binding protein